MRVSINLATRPYQDVRAFALRWGVMLILLAAIAAGLSYAAVRGWQSTSAIGSSISTDESQISKLNDDISKGNTELNRPANREIRMESAFLNTLIARKAFSWTEAFSTLEKIMPPRLHVVSMQPELDDQNRLTLKMRVAGDSRDSAITLLRRMEATPEFQQPQIETESQGRNGQYESQIATFYAPALPGSPAPEATGIDEKQPKRKPARPAKTASAAGQHPGVQ